MTVEEKAQKLLEWVAEQFPAHKWVLQSSEDFGRAVDFFRGLE